MFDKQVIIKIGRQTTTTTTAIYGSLDFVHDNPYHHNLFCCSIKIMSSNTSLSTPTLYLELYLFVIVIEALSREIQLPYHRSCRMQMTCL